VTPTEEKRRSEYFKERDHCEDLDANGIILKWIIRNKMGA
jgi:hypothetical protein